MTAVMSPLLALLLCPPAAAAEVNLDGIVFDEPLDDLDALFGPGRTEDLAAWIKTVAQLLAEEPGFPAQDTVVFDVVLSASAPPQVSVRDGHTVKGSVWSWTAPGGLPDLRLRAASIPLSLVVTAPGGPGAVVAPRLWSSRIPADASYGALEQAIAERARSYVLPLTALLESDVDPQFVGVRRTGELLLDMDRAGTYDEGRLYADPGFWRGMLEMVPGNPLVEAAPVLAGLSAGHLEAQWRLLSLLAQLSQQDSFVAFHLRELEDVYNRMEGLRSARIQQGIALEEGGQHEAAIAVYEEVLQQSPCSAWAIYERGFSRRSLGLLEAPEQVGEVHRQIYACDPLYPLGLSATGPDEWATLRWRLSMGGLFEHQGSLTTDLVVLGDAALELGEPGQAGQAWWLALQLADEGPRPREQLLADVLLAATEAGAASFPADTFDNPEPMLADARARRAARQAPPADAKVKKKGKKR